MELFIQPTDVWLFRDGRSFSAGSDHRAESLFPPFPTVIQGALRSKHLVFEGVDLTDKARIESKVGTGYDYKDFCIRGPIIVKEGVRYYPAPADAIAVDEDGYILRPLRPTTVSSEVKTNAPTANLLLSPDDLEPQKSRVNLWLTEEALRRYLAGNAVRTISGEKLFVRESRPGIELDYGRRATKQGQLYEVEFIRPEMGVGIWVEVDGFDSWPPQGLLWLGGEARSGYFKQCPASSPPLLKAGESLPDQKFKLYLATPTYFAEGWRPDDGNWDQYFTGPVELIAAAIGRYQSVGGYDWAKRWHKTAHRYVPAGSVYYFRAKDGPVELKQDWMCDPAPVEGRDDPARIGQIGFGQVIAAAWE